MCVLPNIQYCHKTVLLIDVNHFLLKDNNIYIIYYIIYPVLSMADAETLVYAFASSRLEYCNTLFAGLPKSTINKLQFEQNTAARILTQTRNFDHITPVLISLHWLLVYARSDFKTLLLTYGLIPSYLTPLVTPHIPAIPADYTITK